jgi:hypothetical protein
MPVALRAADDWTSVGGVTTTPDPVGIGLSGPLSAKLHVVSSSNTSVMYLYGPSASTNGTPQGALFTDTQATEGYCCGILMNLTGASLIRVSNLQFGQWGVPLVQSLGGAALYLNGSAVTGSVPGDVIVGYGGLNAGLRVLTSGNSISSLISCAIRADMATSRGNSTSGVTSRRSIRRTHLTCRRFRNIGSITSTPSRAGPSRHAKQRTSTPVRM